MQMLIYLQHIINTQENGGYFSVCIFVLRVCMRASACTQVQHVLVLVVMPC